MLWLQSSSEEEGIESNEKNNKVLNEYIENKNSKISKNRVYKIGIK